MTTIRTLAISFVLATAALSASAQSQPAASASMPMSGNAMPMMDNAMPHDCGKAIAKHDHGADRGTPSMQAKAAPCGPIAGAPTPAAAASAAKKQPRHDHAKFHKNS